MTKMKKSYKIFHEYINLICICVYNIYVYTILWIMMKFEILLITPNAYYISSKF